MAQVNTDCLWHGTLRDLNLLDRNEKREISEFNSAKQSVLAFTFIRLPTTEMPKESDRACFVDSEIHCLIRCAS